MSSEEIWVGGRNRKALSAGMAAGLACLMWLAIWAPAAGADPFAMTFTEARANVGASQLSDASLFSAPDAAPFAGRIDPGSGAITTGALEVPQFSTFISDPLDTSVTVDFEIGVINGSFDQATGALSLSGKAGGTLKTEGKECIVSTEPATLTLSTAGNSGGTNPRSGAPFSAGLAGTGAIAGQWSDMKATPVDTDPGGDTSVCEVVEEHIEGPGGIWLEQQGLGLPNEPPVDPPPPTPTCVVPRLIGKTLPRAVTALRASHCKLRTVSKPRRRKGRHRPLVVRSSSPGVGASPADGLVDLRLGPKIRRAHR